MTLAILGHDFAYEMECVIRIFFPGAHISIVKLQNFTDDDYIITEANFAAGDTVPLYVRIKIDDEIKQISREIRAGDNELCERELGVMLFTLLSEYTGKRPMWGILTGIRPVRLCGQWRSQGLNDAQILSRLTDGYMVSRKKAKLCLLTGKAQQAIISHNKPDTFSLYIGIPFCPARCLYCSFVSHAIDKARKLVPDYVRLLCVEIGEIAAASRRMGLRLLTVYMGGGTPTILEPPELARILTAVETGFDFSNLLEYTVEAGRPDTITADKLKTLRDFNVGRISVNPQSMNDDVLKAVGRSHTAEQARESFYLARQAGFRSINMDLIAGLPTETASGFQESLDSVIALSPDNITVHALTVKRSSHLRDDGDAFAAVNPETSYMQEYAQNELAGNGYLPYYLYRQKATADNLENIGFAKAGHEGVYNIYSMEDTHNILAAGAGGVSKLIQGGGLVKRVFNYKYPYEYINRFDEIVKRKGEYMCEK